MEVDPPPPKTVLQLLLRQYHDICQEILNIEDDALGLE